MQTTKADVLANLRNRDIKYTAKMLRQVYMANQEGNTLGMQPAQVALVNKVVTQIENFKPVLRADLTAAKQVVRSRADLVADYMTETAGRAFNF